MPTFGWGVGYPSTPVGPSGLPLFTERLCRVSLAQYAQLLGIHEQEFWGVKRGTYVPPKYTFWTGEERWRIAYRLCEAKWLIASDTMVYLDPTWIADERLPFNGRNPVSLRWKHFITAGQKAVSVYDQDAVISYSGEYGRAQVAHGGVGSASEVRVWYSDMLYAAGPEPSYIEFDDTNITITFPRYRLIKPGLMTEEYVPVNWDNLSNFVDTIAITREYTDLSVQAYVRVNNGCYSCEEVCQTACVVATDARLSWTRITPAVYSAGSWVSASCYRGIPEEVRVYYKAGMVSLPPGFNDIVTRLAHSLMPEAECPSDKDVQHRFWKRDRRIPEGATTRERVNCPWGQSDGAWAAWMFVEHSPYNYAKGGGWLC